MLLFSQTGDYMNFISKIINGYKLNKRQKEVNKKYKEEGLTNNVLDAQIAINKKRNELDIPDPNNKIYKKWVQ